MFAELWSETRFRLRAVFRRDTVSRELDDELRFHLEKEYEKHVRAGMHPDEARRKAALAFGGLNRIKDDTRDAHGVALIEDAAHDVRYALRGLRARPLFTSVVVGALALGIGVNAAMFSVIDRVMFRPPAMLRDPSAVNRVLLDWTATDGRRGYQVSIEYRRYLDLKQWSRSISSAAVFANRSLAVGRGADTKELIVSAVSAELFDFFDASPLIGRFFTREDDAMPAGHNVAVISAGFWKSHYGGRAEALGASIDIGRSTYQVIGVAPEGFEGVGEGDSPVAFIPITSLAASVSPTFAKDYSWSWLQILVRRKPGVTVEAASADLTNAFVRSWNVERELVTALAPASVVRPEALAAPIQLARGPMARTETKVLRWIGAMAIIVLLVACANVANLLIARTLRRQRELAVRRALGGSRARLIRQLITEALVLAMIGGALGLLGARFTATALRRLFIDSSMRVSVLGDARTVLFAVAITAIAAVVAGVVPALQSVRGDLAGSLKAGSREGAYRQSFARVALLVFQTALSVILLVGAGLFVRSLQQVRATRLGYDVEPVLYVQANARGVKLNTAEATALADRLIEAARATPGVVNATLAVSAPFWSNESRGFTVPGVDSVQKLGRFMLQAGSPDYFVTTGTRILRGRGFTTEDRANAPRVTLVSESMARVLWHAENPIGKCMRIGGDTMPCTTVVGITEDMKADRITSDQEFSYYLPMAQYRAAFGQGPATMFVRVHGRSDDFAEALRARLQRVMPGASFVNVTPFHELVDPEMRSWSSGATMFLAFGSLALVLAAIGLYAVIAFSVAQRSHDIGVRIALGAQVRDVLRLIVGEGVRVTIAGVALGSLVAFVAGRAIEPLLFRETPRDPVVFAGVAALLVVVGMLASVIPASRAAQVDPNVTLRAD